MSPFDMQGVSHHFSFSVFRTLSVRHKERKAVAGYKRFNFEGDMYENYRRI